MHLRLDASVVETDTAELWPVYRSVFDDHPDIGTWRDAVWDRHVLRDGFRLARAYDADTLVGFAYGYTGERGQWWTDHASLALDPDVAMDWLGGHFELVSLGVIASARGRGLGRGLMRHLLSDLPHGRLLLMTTSDAGDPARRLYDSDGWQVLGAGIGEATVIMGKRVGAG